MGGGGWVRGALLNPEGDPKMEMWPGRGQEIRGSWATVYFKVF